MWRGAVQRRRSWKAKALCWSLRGYPCCALTLVVLLRLQEGCFAEQHLFQHKLRYINNHVGAEGHKNKTYGIGPSNLYGKELSTFKLFLIRQTHLAKRWQTSFCLHDESSTCKFRTKTQIALKVLNTRFFTAFLLVYISFWLEEVCSAACQIKTENDTR